MATVDYTNQIEKLYIAYFGRPGDKAGVAWWNNDANNTDGNFDSLYANFAKSAEYTAMHAGQSNTALINSLYQALFGRSADVDGLNYWLGQLMSGVKVDVIAAALVNGAIGDDVTTLTNKAAAATLFTNNLDTSAEVIGYDGSAAFASARSFLSGVTSTAATADQVNAAILAATSITVAGQTFSLTTNADVIPGLLGSAGITSNEGNNSIYGTNTTLGAGDNLNGGLGNDTLVYSSSGAVAVNQAGFVTTSVENAIVTSDATGGTAFDTTGMTGLVNISNNNSSQNVTFVGGTALLGLGLTNVGAASRATNIAATSVTYNAATVAGTADKQALTLSNNKNVDGSAIGVVTVNGIEEFNVTTSGGSSLLDGIASTSLKKITVAGDQSLTLAKTTGIGGINFTDNAAVNVLDASGLTGTAALDVTIGANTATLDVAVTGGAGNDRADFSTGFDKLDSFTGGDGRDTLALTQAVATAQTATTGGTVATVEILEITNGGTGTTNLDNFPGVDTVFYSGLTGGSALAAASTITNAVTGITVQVNVDAVAQNNTTTLKTNGTTDVINYVFNKVGTADALGTVSAAQFETVNITTGDDAAVLGTGVLTIADLTETAATKLVIAGNAALTIASSTNPGTPILATIDASAATAAVTISGVNLATGGATVTLGSANDVFNVALANGADTFDLTKGGNDSIVYTTLAQSGVAMDTVKGFVSGSDFIDLRTFVTPIVSSSQFKGVKASFGEAQGALTTGVPSAVFDASSSILWVDNNGDGTLDSRDFRVKLDGITSITAADLKLGATGNTITLSAAAATVDLTTKTKADNFSTNENDTINSTIAFIAGSTINGLIGTDTLVLTTAGAVGALPATITNVEALTLATVGTTANTGVAFDNAGVFASVTGSSNADTLVTTLQLAEGGTVNLGAGNDVITALDMFDTAAQAGNSASDGTSYKFNIDMGAGDDTVTTGTAVAFTVDSILNGGDGTDTLNLVTTSNISAGSVTGFEVCNLLGAASAMTTAQYNSFTGGVATTAVAGNTLTLTTVGSITTTALTAGNIGVETYVLANGVNNVTTGGVAAALQIVTGSAGAETFNTTVANGFFHTITAAGGTDILNISGGITAAATLSDAAAGAAAVIGATGVETLNISGASTANTLTIVNTTVGDLTTINASGVTGGGISLVTTGLTAVTDRTITLTSGNDTITNLVGTAGKTLTVDFGTGNATVSANAVVSGGLLTLKATNTAGSTTGILFQAMTAPFATGSATGTLIDTNVDVTAIKIGAIGGVGVAVAGQVYIDSTTSAGNTIITQDVNGDGAFGSGDIQIVLTGQAYTGVGASIIAGNILL